ncbi:MAG TPA: TetR/AcrR family transcriptional regulator [Myxococcales bacterium]|nr:TetR/AcrR family transcriptional regulator [Myxococcales bacterium]
MARPIRANAAATKRRVLTNASYLFSQNTLGGASIRDIARESKVSLATVLHYFGSKEGLYQACVESMYTELEELQSAVGPTFAAGGTVEEIIQGAIKTTLRFAREHRGAIRLTLRDVLDEGEVRIDRRDKFLVPFLDQGSRAMATLTTRSAAELRLLLQSLSHLIVRYSLSSVRELAVVVGLEHAVDLESSEATPEIEERVVAAVEKHLTQVALTMLKLNGATR